MRVIRIILGSVGVAGVLFAALVLERLVFLGNAGNAGSYAGWTLTWFAYAIIPIAIISIVTIVPMVLNLHESAISRKLIGSGIFAVIQLLIWSLITYWAPFPRNLWIGVVALLLLFMVDAATLTVTKKD